MTILLIMIMLITIMTVMIMSINNENKTMAQDNENGLLITTITTINNNKEDGKDECKTIMKTTLSKMLIMTILIVIIIRITITITIFIAILNCQSTHPFPRPPTCFPAHLFPRPRFDMRAGVAAQSRDSGLSVAIWQTESYGNLSRHPQGLQRYARSGERCWSTVSRKEAVNRLPSCRRS